MGERTDKPFSQYPMSLNGYSWVEGNVVSAVDPSGNCSNQNGGCLDAVARLEARYRNVMFHWDGRNLPCRLPGCGVYSDVCNSLKPIWEVSCTGDEWLRKLCGANPTVSTVNPGGGQRTSWTTEEVNRIGISLDVLSTALTSQSGAKLAAFIDRVLFVKSDAAYSPSAETVRNISQSFAIVEGKQIFTDSSIFFFETWQNSVNRDAAYATWVALHELGHVIANKVSGYDSLYGDLIASYQDKRFNAQPTEYSSLNAPFGNIEPIIEAITAVIWNATYASFGFTQSGAGNQFGYDIHQYRVNVCDIRSIIDEQTLSD